MLALAAKYIDDKLILIESSNKPRATTTNRKRRSLKRSMIYEKDESAESRARARETQPKRERQSEAKVDENKEKFIS